MKAKNTCEVQIKTGEFEFINVKLTGSPEDAVNKFLELRGEWSRATRGPDRKEWNRILDKYLLGEGISETDHTSLSETQKWLLHELDKSNARLSAKGATAPKDY